VKILRTEFEMMQAYRDRIRELGLSHATVDAISGLPDGYTSKLMCDPPMKGIGPKARELLNGALGMGFVVAVDQEQVEKVSGRWVKRRRAIDKKKQKLLPPSISLSMGNEVPTMVQITPELQRKLVDRDHMKRIGKMGAKRRNKIMGKRARQRAASHAARMRWTAKRAAGHA
jgi:hypothetical protein